jgi:hypothetical protein
MKIRLVLFLILIASHVGSSAVWAACDPIMREVQERIKHPNLRSVEACLEDLDARLRDTYNQELTQTDQWASDYSGLAHLSEKVADIQRRYDAALADYVAEHKIRKAPINQMITELEQIRTVLREGPKASQSKGPPETETVEPADPVNAWQALRENPALIESETNYLVPLRNGGFLTARFSDAVVTGLLRNKEWARAAGKTLRAMESGIIPGNYKSSGIKKFSSYGNVLEVSFFDQQLGGVRAGGYEHEGVIHITIVFFAGDHNNAKYSERFATKVQESRKARGHNGD